MRRFIVMFQDLKIMKRLRLSMRKRQGSVKLMAYVCGSYPNDFALHRFVGVQGNTEKFMHTFNNCFRDTRRHERSF